MSREEAQGNELCRPQDMDTWKLLIVEDEEEVHTATKFALKRLVFEGKKLSFISAYSAMEARQILANTADIAVILLDVVMEKETAGLELVKFIREDLQNNLVRIILRTGQPGQAPEQQVILEYDINDYQEKTELTTQKLHTAVITALRSYRDLTIIDNTRMGLEKIIESLNSIHKIKSICNLASGALTQLVAILRLKPNALYCQISGFAASRNQISDFLVLAATGIYTPLLGQSIDKHLSTLQQDHIAAAYNNKQSMFYEDHFVVYSCTKLGTENIFYLEGMNPLNPWQHHLIEIFCLNVSSAFDNCYLNEEIEDTQREILNILGEVAEKRSHETSRHVKRVAEYARFLALRYGLSEEEADLLQLAAPTHDIGKLGIPDHILNKPGRLSDLEFELMKMHSEIGYEMLKNAKHSILQAGALIALQHHERYDGTGYPSAYKGEEIHIYGRIVALADVFDALSHDRVYKEAWPLEKILDYIRNERAGHFDPQLVDILMDNLDEFLKIRNSFPDQ